jgi:hypothetical protein
MKDLYWKVPTSVRAKADHPAGTLNPEGYVAVQLYGKFLKAHRIIWLLHNKCWPSDTIDHIDRNRSNNDINNLRDVAPHQNSANGNHHADSLAQNKGVAYDPNYAAKPWRVDIRRRGESRYRKYFATYDEACDAADAVYAWIDEHPTEGEALPKK